MMTPTMVPRSAWTSKLPYNNDGVTTRPLLGKPVTYLTAHYTGISWHLNNGARRYPDNVQATAMMPSFQRVAQNTGKSFEYNYVIPHRVNGQPEVWEYAGTYRGAHSSGENSVAVGVLLLLGVDNHPSYSDYDSSKPTVWQEPSDEMFEAFRWLRDMVLTPGGLFRPGTTATIPHFRMPGASTSCPGKPLTDRFNDLLQPWTPPDTGDDAMNDAQFREMMDKLEEIRRQTALGTTRLGYLANKWSGPVLRAIRERSSATQTTNTNSALRRIEQVLEAISVDADRIGDHFVGQDDPETAVEE